MKNEPPLISIIMATYNRAHLIEETLRSIAVQSYQNWECLIIDDGSKDETREVVETFGNEDSRFQYFKRSSSHKKGLPGSRNHGLTLAKGEYLVFFDDDDIPHPDCLKWSLEEILNYKADYCRFLRSVFFQEINKDFNRFQDYEVTLYNPLEVEKMITGKIPFNSCQVLWKANCFENEIFNEELMFAEEWEMYTRLLLKKPKGISIEKYLYFGRKHPNSNTGEFHRREPVRLNSQIKAILLVIDNLSSKDLFNEKLKVYFLQMGFEFNSLAVIRKSLDASKSNVLIKLKYQIGYHLYPILKPIFYLKGKISKS